MENANGNPTNNNNKHPVQIAYGLALHRLTQSVNLHTDTCMHIDSLFKHLIQTMKYMHGCGLHVSLNSIINEYVEMGFRLDGLLAQLTKITLVLPFSHQNKKIPFHEFLDERTATMHSLSNWFHEDLLLNKQQLNRFQIVSSQLHQQQRAFALQPI